MRCALLAIIIFCTGCVPSPNRPLGQSAAPAESSEPTSEVASGDASPSTSETWDETSEALPLSLVPRSTATGMVELKPDDSSINDSPDASPSGSLSLLAPNDAPSLSLAPSAAEESDHLHPAISSSGHDKSMVDASRMTVTPHIIKDEDADGKLGIDIPAATVAKLEDSPPAWEEAESPPISSLPVGEPPATVLSPAMTESEPDTAAQLAPRIDSITAQSPKTNELIPREVLFGIPERARPRISPDGKQLAFLAPRNGVLNIWIAPIENVDQAIPVTNDAHRSIRNFFWAYTNQHIVYSRDQNGNEDFHVYSIDVRNNTVKDLTPIEGIAARVEAVSQRIPNEVLIGLNDRAPHQYHDLYRVNLITGQRQLVLENPGFTSLLADDDYRVRFALSFTPDGGQMIVRRDASSERGWSVYLQIGPEDAMTTGFAGFDKLGESVYLFDSRERNTSALRQLDLKTNRLRLLAEDERSDVAGVLLHPTEKHVEAVTFNYDRRTWKVLDARVQPDIEYLQAVTDGDLQIASRTLDDSAWIVAYTMDDGPIRYYYYRRDPREATLLFTSDSALSSLPLVKMHPATIKSRDGLELVSYYSIPQAADPNSMGEPSSPLPLVLDVHGGPWARDVWGYDPVHQLLANRGYAVMSVNFRGSTGFGKQFINAADGEWAGKMHDDLVDAVEWAVERGIADPTRVAIMGGSYGGYASLVGLTFTPSLFACGIDIVGPADLETLLKNPPPHWTPMMSLLKRRVGDHESDEGRRSLQSRSPLAFADRITKPLLIAQGAMDPRVKRSEAEQIVSTMRRQQVPVTYMLYPNEGHGFARPANRFAFYAVAEAFLAEHLGGRHQPIDDAFQRAEFQVPVGSDAVPGLRVALNNVELRAAADTSDEYR